MELESIATKVNINYQNNTQKKEGKKITSYAFAKVLRLLVKLKVGKFVSFHLCIKKEKNLQNK